MKSFIRILVLLFFIQLSNNALATESIIGAWQGILSTGPEFEMTVRFKISRNVDGSYSVIVGSPDGIGIEDTDANSVTYDAGNLKVDVAELSGSYEGNFKEGKIVGEWKQEGSSFPLILGPMENYKLPKEIIDKLVGEWHIETPSITGLSGLACIFRFNLSEDGEIEGVMDQTTSGETDIPLSDFQMTDDGSLTFRILAENRRVFKGKVGENRIVGAMQFQPGGSFYPQLVKKGKYIPRESGKDLPEDLKEKLIGKWHGDLGASTLTFTFYEPMPGTFIALVENPDPETEGAPFTDSDIDGEKITLKTEYLNTEFIGKFSGDTLEGEWVQDGKGNPIVMTKEKP